MADTEALIGRYEVAVPGLKAVGDSVRVVEGPGRVRLIKRFKTNFFSDEMLQKVETSLLVPPKDGKGDDEEAKKHRLWFQEIFDSVMKGDRRAYFYLTGGALVFLLGGAGAVFEFKGRKAKDIRLIPALISRWRRRLDIKNN